MAEYCEMMQALELGIATGDARSRRSDRAGSNELQFSALRQKGGPIFNFRSEGGSFANSNRCLIPASAFFEFTGKKYPKAKHRFILNDARFMAIAGIWRDGEGNHPPAFAMLTTEPGPDVAPIHNRQIVVLQPSDWAAWIHLTEPEKELLRPLPKGSLAVETVRAL